MKITALYITAALLLISTNIPEVSLEKMYDYDDEYSEAREHLPFVSYNEYIRQIHSMINAYRGDTDRRMVVETNALINTKYRAWKRNADLINSLLALPKGMNDAGRR